MGDTNERGPARTPTPAPTRPSTATPEPFKFPGWITDPQDLVLLAFNPISRDQINFANINTGEVYASPIHGFNSTQWVSDHQIAVEFTGKLTILDLHMGTSVDYVDQASIDQFWKDQPNQPRFVIGQDYGQDEAPVMVTDNTSQVTFQLTDPADQIYDRQTALSPTAPQLAVLESAVPPEPFLTAAERLKIYNLVTRAVIASFSGEFSRIEWSPNGQEILYRRESTGAHIQNAPPCILNISSGQSRCLYRVTQGHPRDFTGEYHWSPDGKWVSFIYYASTSPKLTAGLCVFGLATGQMMCPTTKISVIKDQAIIYSAWAPDSQHLLFIYDTSCPGCDYRDNPFLAEIATDGNDFITISSGVWDFLPDSWRPAP